MAQYQRQAHFSMASSRRPSVSDSTQHHPDLAVFANQGKGLLIPQGGVFYTDRPAGYQTLPQNHHVVDIALSPSRTRVRLDGNKPEEYDAPAGSILIKPAEVEGRLDWPNTRESAIIALGQDRLRDLAKQQFGNVETELNSPPPGTVDQTALRIARLLRVELTREQGPSEFYVDSLVDILGLHLLNTYSSPTKAPQQQTKGGLSRQAARKVREFLNDNFTHKISVKELAALANLSPKHFTQAFSRTFGQAPHRYLLDLRLAHATTLLAETKMTATEIAYQSGFSSQSHLTTAMRKYRHTTPTRLRRG
ncbi:AraC family transcriptional regulator [Mesorhizobium sp. WSM4935]|uniref:helix-turn-helix domain-containing protein n=1 Tax=Mesorhizobium sp. WSM4935 TaxID=3038547 RepID=UPI0024156A13|nr:AraC family transcriptional regulator [Mesorhizobium sp. WSM4935]MDG4879060.1 AraC family transcriptional regulator [Mesorhizobium sp. WSM4935]